MDLANAPNMWMMITLVCALASFTLAFGVSSLMGHSRVKSLKYARDKALQEAAQLREASEKSGPAEKAEEARPADTVPTDLGEDTGKRKSRLSLIEEAMAAHRLALMQLSETRPTSGESAIIAADLSSLNLDESTKPALIWRNRYLESRLRLLSKQSTKPDPDITEPLPDDQSSALIALPSQSGLDQNEREAFQRLQWRNRFLEEKLAYLDMCRAKAPAPARSERIGDEGSKADNVQQAEQKGDTSDAEILAAVAAEIAKFAAPMVVPQAAPLAVPPVATLDSAGTHELTDQMSAPETAPADQADESLQTVNTFLATLASEGQLEKPAMQPKPENAEDDLKSIQSLKTDVSKSLNELGIWRVEQIANWTPQNIAWVNTYFNMDNPSETQKWVEQAASLLEDKALAP